MSNQKETMAIGCISGEIIDGRNFNKYEEYPYSLFHLSISFFDCFDKTLFISEFSNLLKSFGLITTFNIGRLFESREPNKILCPSNMLHCEIIFAPNKKMIKLNFDKFSPVIRRSIKYIKIIGAKSNINNNYRIKLNCHDLVNLASVEAYNANLKLNSCAFENCISLSYVSSDKLIAAQSFHGLFRNCYVLRRVSDLALEGNKIFTDISANEMFANCHNLLCAPELTGTGVLEGLNSMFYKCESLKEVPVFDTHNVSDMSGMFADCKSLEYPPKLNTEKLLYAEDMFNGCKNLKEKFETTNNKISLATSDMYTDTPFESLESTKE